MGMEFLLMLMLHLSEPASGGDFFYVQPVDSGVKLQELKGKHFRILPAPSPEIPARRLPSLEKRDRIFNEAGLGGALESLDIFDRDSLYLRLSLTDEHVFDRIVASYPALTDKRAELRKAQTLILAAEESGQKK
jgi:hypothetical protein